MIRAAGILFKCGNRVLLIRRSGEGDYEGDWAFPGGKIEENETPEGAAVRECKEELGHCPKGKRALFARRADGNVDYQTFVQPVEATFKPTLNDEHDGFVWAEIGDWPKPLHPGARIVLNKLTMNELEVAKAIVRGDLTSPQHYMNISLFAIRVTGTGTAYRTAHEEFVYRPPENYLTDEFLERCNGLPVIYEHPEGTKMDSEEFANRIVGVLILPYISGSEVWGIAKIYDDAAAALMEHEPMSTSPSVVFKKNSANEKVELENGKTLLIEGIPALLDHLAICKQGVWDKNGDPSGIVSTTVIDKGEGPFAPSEQKEVIMNPEEMAAADKARKDAEEKEEMRARKDAEAGEKLDQILSGLKDCHTRLDAMGTRMDSYDKARKDSEEKEKEKEGGGAEMRGDKTRKDGEDMPKDPKDQKAAGEEMKGELKEEGKGLEFEKKDSNVEGNAPRMDKEVEALKSRMDAAEKMIPRELPESEAAKYADAQAKCDAVAQLHGKQAPRPMVGESTVNYRRRLARQYQQFSPKWRDKELSQIGASVLDIAEEMIYADATAAAMHPIDIPRGEFREITRTDPHTGQRITRFHGTGTFFSQLSAPSRRVTAFVNHNRGA